MARDGVAIGPKRPTAWADSRLQSSAMRDKKDLFLKFNESNISVRRYSKNHRCFFINYESRFFVRMRWTFGL